MNMENTDFEKMTEEEFDMWLHSIFSYIQFYPEYKEKFEEMFEKCCCDFDNVEIIIKERMK